MSMFKHYLLMLFFMALGGGYLAYQLISNEANIPILPEIGLYFLYAHGMLLAGFIWMFLVKTMSSAFYKEGYAEFHTGFAMLAAFGFAIYLNLELYHANYFDTDSATLFISILAVPLGATMGYRVEIDPT